MTADLSACAQRFEMRVVVNVVGIRLAMWQVTGEASRSGGLLGGVRALANDGENILSKREEHAILVVGYEVASRSL